MESKTKRSKLFTTTIDCKTLDEFKILCKKKGIPMSIVISALMSGYLIDDLRKNETKKSLVKDLKEKKVK